MTSSFDVCAFLCYWWRGCAETDQLMMSSVTHDRLFKNKDIANVVM